LIVVALNLMKFNRKVVWISTFITDNNYHFIYFLNQMLPQSLCQRR